MGTGTIDAQRPLCSGGGVLAVWDFVLLYTGVTCQVRLLQGGQLHRTGELEQPQSSLSGGQTG